MHPGHSLAQQDLLVRQLEMEQSQQAMGLWNPPLWKIQKLKRRTAMMRRKGMASAIQA